MPQFELTDFLPYLLNQAAETTSLQFRRLYKERYGLLRTDWRVLFHLGQYGPLTAVEITDRAMIHKTKISRAAARLIEMRLVTEERSDQDRRRKTLHLTPHGEKVFNDLRNQAEAYDAEISSRLAPDETKTLRKILRRIAVQK